MLRITQKHGQHCYYRATCSDILRVLNPDRQSSPNFKLGIGDDHCHQDRGDEKADLGRQPHHRYWSSGLLELEIESGEEKS